MTDDATLSDFGGSEPSDADDAGNGDSAADTDSASRGGGQAQSELGDDDSERVESADGAVEDDITADIDEGPSGDTGLSTYGWGEYTCHRCGGETDRVWREDGVLVCPDCKSW